MQRYGLQIRTKPPSSSSSRAPPPPARPLAAFADDDDDDVEKEILRQAAKKRALQKVEEQQKKALEEDPSVYAYDELYDEMKEKEARPKMQDKVVREVTKKKDLSDFYFGLERNVAFGARTHANTKCADPQKSDNKPEDTNTSSLGAEASEPSPKRRRESSVGSEGAKSMEEPVASRTRDSTAAASTEKNVTDVPSNAKETPQSTQPAKVTDDHYKRGDDALAAARARALARKKAKEQQL